MRLAWRRRRASSLSGSGAISIYNGPLKVRLIMPLLQRISSKLLKRVKMSRTLEDEQQRSALFPSVGRRREGAAVELSIAREAVWLKRLI